MRIVSLVENTTNSELTAKHGLSLYIETRRHRILFDLGPDNTLFENAAKRGIDISTVDTVVISHGHADHGGALKKFLEINSQAAVYVQREAFEPHYSKVWFCKVPIGLDRSLMSHRQLVLLEGDCTIDDELRLFTVKSRSDRFYSPANRVLYDERGQDAFGHEQNLIIAENKMVLIMGCGHSGVVNIMDVAAKYRPSLCVGGFHLFNPVTRKSVPESLLDDIAAELRGKYADTLFYTCHCTGKPAFDYLARHMDNMHYIACGDTLEI